MGRQQVYGDENNEEIKRLFEVEKLSLNAISRQFGMHPQVVKRKLAKMGVNSRDKSQAMRIYHQQRKGKVTAGGEKQSN